MSGRAATLGLALAIGFALPWVPALDARDHGVMGQTWGIEEVDLLSTIAGRLQTLQANGGIERMQQQLAAKTRERVIRPIPVEGISPATEPRKWTYDPSIVVENDIRDTKGNLIAERGRRVNPLDFVQLRADLVFVDGEDPAQIAWATKRYATGAAKIIFVSGSPFEQMKVHQRRFFFDQKGQLTGKFGIEHTPAVVRAQGSVLAVEELVLGRGGKPS